MTWTCRFVCLLALGFAAPVWADVLPRIEVTPYVGYRGGGNWLAVDGDADLEGAVSYGVFVNFRAKYNTQWEVFYGRQSTQVDTVGATLDGSVLDVDLDYFHIGGSYVFNDKRLSPFFAMTFGATRVSPGNSPLSDETYFSGSMGLGLRYELQRNLGLRLEARVLSLFGKSNSLVFCTVIDNEEACGLAGDGGAIPQGEVLAGLTFRF